ncbi:MAG: aldo/keto reductase, partial [Planctomycetales bacterium]|nr:aldo/keto reductase [Planctomycetales bacterium]
LTPERLEFVRKLKKLADQLGTSIPKLAIAWCLKNPNVSTVILGASKVAHLEETLESLDTVPLLTAEVMEQIDGYSENI